MSQKVINKVKQFADNDNLQFGEIVVDINAQNPSITFIDEEYKDIKIHPVKDVSKEVEQLMADMELKASAENLDKTNQKLTETTNRVTSLEGEMNLTSQSLTSAQARINKNSDDINTMNELLTKQTTDLSKLGGIMTDVSQNASAISILETNVSTIAAKANANANDITSLGAKISNNTKSVNGLVGDISTINSSINTLKSELGSTYHIKGAKTVTDLNRLSLADCSMGDVYNLTTTGVVTKGADNTSFTVRAGDNVVWIKKSDSEGYWDPLMCPVTIPTDNPITVVDGAQSNGQAYTMDNIKDAMKDVTVNNQVTYYLVTADGHASMDSGTGNKRTSLPSYNATTGKQDWVGGFFLIDSDVNTRQVGSWQKAYNLLTGDEYIRFCCYNSSAEGKKSWTQWKRNLTTEDIDVKFLSSDFNAKDVIGALNELKAGVGNGATTTTVQTMGLKVKRTDTESNTTPTSMSADSTNSYTFIADGDNDACEDNLYMVVHDGTKNVLNLGVKKGAYVQKTVTELTQMFTTAKHETFKNGARKDYNDLLKVNVNASKQVELGMEYLPDNPITIIDGDYDGRINSFNWLTTVDGNAGRATYCAIKKDGISKVEDGYPSEFKNGCLLLTCDTGDCYKSGLNNLHGTFQIAVSMETNTLASGKVILKGRKAYRMRYLAPTEENPEHCSWTSWVYEELSDKTVDNEVNILTKKDLNWLGSAHNSDYRNGVSYYYIAPEYYENITQDDGMLQKSEFSKGAWVIHYDVDGKGLGTFQQLVSVSTGDIATRMITRLGDKGEGHYGNWTFNKIDTDAYQTKAIESTTIYKANSATTILAAFAEINKALQAVESGILSQLDDYQTVKVNVAGLTKKTVEACLAELASKVKILEATASSGSGTTTVEPYVDDRDFMFKIRGKGGAWRKIPFNKVYPEKDGDTTFGAALEVRDYYEGKLCDEEGQTLATTPTTGSEPVSSFINLTGELMPSGASRNRIVMQVQTEKFVDSVYPYNGVTSDGISYVTNKSASYGVFLDLHTLDKLLWCFDDGRYYNMPENSSSLSSAEYLSYANGWGLKTATDVANRQAVVGGELATQAQLKYLLNSQGYGFTVLTEAGKKRLYLTKNGSTVYYIGVWLDTITNGGRCGFWLKDGGIQFTLTSNGLEYKIESNKPSTVGYLATGALYVMAKNSVAKKLVAHNANDNRHMDDGDKYKVQNMENIIDKRLRNMLDAFIPVGTVMPYLPYNDDKTLSSELSFASPSMLVENGGNWALCDGQVHAGYETPDLRSVAPVGANGLTTKPNTIASVSHSHNLYYKSTKKESRNDGSLTPQGNRIGMLYIGSSASNYQTMMNMENGNGENSGSVTLTHTMSNTPGLYTWYLIRVR